MSDEVTFWACDHTENDPPCGEAVERWLHAGLKANPFSTQGALLRCANSRDAAEARARVRAMVRSTGLPYRDDGDDAPSAAPVTTLSPAHEKDADDQPGDDAEAVTLPPPPASSSGLARLIYAAKATHTAPAPTPRAVEAQSTETTARRRHRSVLDDVATRADEDDDEEEFGVVLPLEVPPAVTPEATAEKHPSQMTREEFLRQFHRAPRRGEIGQSAEEIARAEELGYVMSGSRSKASQLYVDRIQRQLHEREAAKLQRQFRKVEDERMDASLITHLAQIVNAHTNN